MVNYSRILKILCSLAIIAVCVLGLYFRYYALESRLLWDDEINQLGHMKGSLVAMMDSISKIEYFSLLAGDFFLIYPFFKWFGFNKWGLAIPHILSTLIGFYLFYLAAKIYLKSSVGVLVSFVILAFNATLIWHSFEIRVYSVLPTLALACFLGARYLVLYIHAMTWRSNALLLVLFLVTIWFHVYGIMIVAVMFAWQWAEHPELFLKNLPRLFYFVLALGLLAAPVWVYSVFIQHADPATEYNFKTQTHSADVHRDVAAYIPALMNNPVGFFKAVLGNLMGCRPLYVLYFGFLAWFLIDAKQKTKQITMLAIVVVVPIALIYAMDLMKSYWFLQRQFIWVIPFFAIVVGWCWESALACVFNRGNRA